MHTRTDVPTTGRWRFLAVTAAIATAALMGACDNNNDTAAEASASPSFATPKEALLAALPTKDTERFSFAIAGAESTGSGVIDAPAGAYQLTYESGDSTDELQTKTSWLFIGADVWTRMKFSSPEPMPGFDDIPDKWLQIDKTKVKAENFDLNPSDPLTVIAMLDKLIDVSESGPGKYAGTLDLSKSEELLLVDDQVVADAGEKAKAVPFEAEVDSNGRLTSLTLKWPANGTAKASETKVTFSDYGSAPAITAPPAGETQEAPEDLYPMLG